MNVIELPSFRGKGVFWTIKGTMAATNDSFAYHVATYSQIQQPITLPYSLGIYDCRRAKENFHDKVLMDQLHRSFVTTN